MIAMPSRSYGASSIICARREIDLLHTHDFYTNIFGMTAGFLAGVNVRIASRRETNGMRSGAQQQAERLAYSLAHQIVANSESVKQKLVEEGVNGKRITVIHNGLNLERVIAPLNVSREETLKALGVRRAGEGSNRRSKTFRNDRRQHAARSQRLSDVLARSPARQPSDA